tara:strand:- start:854 stop:2620 length:1767 start_codon:yes stop_codon:yes gene_type:complete
MKYPKNYLEEIKLRLKVSQVVSKTVKLNRRGKEFIGLSPFTTEKTPSFTVSDEKGFYHCFSSGEHGNIFDFLIKTQSLKFGEAVRQLASLAGMQPFRFSKFDEEKEKRYQNYKNIFKDFTNYHHELLLKDNSHSIDYLKKRGINKDTIAEFQIGYVPENSEYYTHLLKKYSEKEISETGLFYKNEKYNKYINRFYSRIIFPIKNIIGDVIAFGGRIIKEKKTAKYINSPETEFYKKGRHVFNLDKAKSATNKEQEVIIVEGYMDVISIYSSGIKNVVSNSGIALTDNQINLVWKFFANPIICLDGDTSGQRAALRIAENLLPQIKENNKIWFVALSNGIDPDDYIKEKGKKSFQDLLTNKLSIEEFIWRIYLKSLDRSDPFATAKFEKKFRNICDTIQDKTLKKYILEKYLEKIKNFTPLQKNFKGKKINNYRVLNETKKISIAKEHLTKEEIKEYSILYIMYNYPEIISPRIEIFNDIKFSSDSLNKLKLELLSLISQNQFDEQNKSQLKNKYLNLINDINQNVVIKNIFLKKDEEKQVEILNEILKELNDIKFSKKIENLENKLMEKFDEKSYSDLMKLKNQINKE